MYIRMLLCTYVYIPVHVISPVGRILDPLCRKPKTDLEVSPTKDPSPVFTS